MNFDVKKAYEVYRTTGTDEVTKLGWTAAELQQQNYQLLTGMLHDLHIPLPGLKVHDAGCGTGHLLAYLKRTEQEPRYYVGTDFMQESLDIARERFPSHDFFLADMMPHGYQPSVTPRVDVTLVFGSLAFHKPRDVEAILNRLWEHSTVALAFNTWWVLDKSYLYFEHIEQLRKCVNRFLRNKQVHQMMGIEYGQPTEALFVVYR